MSKILRLDIITPEKVIYSDDVDMVTVRQSDHRLASILYNHAPLVSSLDIAPVKIVKDGQEMLVSATGGFIEVRENKVTVLANAAELSDQIDISRVLAAKERAERRLAGKIQIMDEDIDDKRANLALLRASERLQVHNYRRKHPKKRIERTEQTERIE